MSDLRETCPDCAVRIDQEHTDGCDIARCWATGEQRLGCGGELHTYKGVQYGEHEGECGEDIWTGIWPGVQECRDLGLWSKPGPGGWVTCDKDDPDATEDLNALVKRCTWDKESRKFVLRNSG